jgi:hypothetical protein
MRFSTSGFFHQTTPSGPLTRFAYGFILAEKFDYKIDFFSGQRCQCPINDQRCH